METWKTCARFPNYQVSDLGRVRRHPDARTKGATPGRVLRQATGKDGYQLVCLYFGGRKRLMARVHQLVAEAFIGPRPDGYVTRHLDDDPRNNVPANLAYGTQEDNYADFLRNRGL